MTQIFVGKKLAGFLQKPYSFSALGLAVRPLLETQDEASLGDRWVPGEKKQSPP